MNEFMLELQTPGGYHTDSGKFVPTRKQARLRAWANATDGSVVLEVRQPGWDMNTRCFAEFDATELVAFFEQIAQRVSETTP